MIQLFSILTTLAALTLATDIPETVVNSTIPKDSFTFGPTCDSKPAYHSYSLNHLCIVTTNLTRALDFYTHVMGLSHIFTYNPIPKYHIAYLGHNTLNFSSCEEFAVKKNEVKGLLELLHLEGSTHKPQPSMQRPNTFSHMGLVVPDVQEAQGRVAARGGRVIKGAGEDVDIRNKELANAYGLGPEAIGGLEEGELEELVKAFGDYRTGSVQSAFVADPDGNLIEIQPPVFE